MPVDFPTLLRKKTGKIQAVQERGEDHEITGCRYPGTFRRNVNSSGPTKVDRSVLSVQTGALEARAFPQLEDKPTAEPSALARGRETLNIA